jgi:translation initiation factor IF-2
MGDFVVAGEAFGKIRAMFDFHGNRIRKAAPSMPVQIMGLNGVPLAGDLFKVYPSEKDARQAVADYKENIINNTTVAPKATLEELFDRVQAGELKELRLVIKADVQGSLEPIVNSLNDLNKEKSGITINILHAETGNISENDVSLAGASKAIVIGFNVQADTAARRMAEKEGVSIRLYDIIYRLIEDIEKAIKGMLAPEFKEVSLGRADILQVFKVSKVGAVAGCRVVQGEIRRNGRARIKHGADILYEGEISSLKHEKDDVREVRQGFECGISFRNFSDYHVGDSVECYFLEKFQG